MRLYLRFRAALMPINPARGTPATSTTTPASQFIRINDFDPDTHAHLTKEQAISLDQHVDEYNAIIRDIADEYGWITVPLNRYVSGIARRRLGGQLKIPYPDRFCQAMARNPMTDHLVEDPQNPKLSTDYLRIDEESGQVYKGGIFSLDGIHPTTIGYGLIAHLYKETMESHGISFDKPLDWDHIISSDTLVTNPPYLLVELRRLIQFLLSQQESFRLTAMVS
ncbi:MAG: hypothetical protein U5J63_16800 [Fodinibius sp.]|nr:hypothetical protein [Fodinibius sp.]